MLVHAIKKMTAGKCTIRNNNKKGSLYCDSIARHCTGDALYLWEALGELKQPQSVDKALEIGKDYAKENNYL